MLSLLSVTSWFRALAMNAAIDRLGMSATEREGQHILDMANARVPYRTGYLEESGQLVRADENEVAIVYNADYAAKVRAHGVALGGRDPYWLDHAFEEAASDGGVMGESFRLGWPTDI